MAWPRSSWYCNGGFMEPIWHVQMLGGLRVVREDGTVAHFRSQNAAALLAYLSLFRSRIHTREELADLLWPEADADAGRVNLRTVLSTLRRELEGGNIPSGSVLVTPGHTEVRLDHTAVTTDVREFENLLKNAARLSASPEDQTRLLTDAVGLYCGPLLPGLFESWAQAERDRLDAEYLRALSSLTAAHAKAGDITAALGYARRAVAVDPLSEKAHTDLIRLLAQSGDRVSALRHYHEMERLLEEQLGAGPSPELRIVVDALKGERGQVSQLPRTEHAMPTASVPARQKHAHANLNRPDTTLSAVVPDPAPVPASILGTRTLPLTFTPFFGREGEAAALGEALRSGVSRLVTVTGPGGSGKTRLAIETARQISPDFPGGVLFVPLAEVRAAEHIAGSIAASLSLTVSPGSEPLEQVVEALTGINEPVLLVLDNFEQLMTDGGIEVVRVLTSRVPQLTLLVTSRQRLLLEAEQDFPLLPLPVPDFPGTPERLLEFSSVQLFVSRAQAARYDFRITGRNAEAIAQLCSRLEGIPLALELAAAWSQTLTPGQMVERLTSRFDWLVSRHRDTPGRHSTLRAAIRWSWELLPGELQQFFARLSVFAGGWALEAAEAVCEEPNALAYLAELRDHSLVLSEEDETYGDAATMRCRLLETLRTFGLEQMDMDEQAQLRERHADYYLRRAEENAPHLGGSHIQQRRLEFLQREHLNLRHALEWTRHALDNEPGSTALSRHLRLCNALGDFWFLRGHLADARRWLLDDDLMGQAELTAAISDTAPEILARFLHSQAEAAQVWGEQNRFIEALGKALEQYRQAGDRCGEGRVLARLARYSQGIPYAERCRIARKARRLCRNAGDRWAEAEALADQAWLVRVRANQYRRAHQMMARAVDFYRAVGDDEHVVAALRERGTWYAWSKETAKADALLSEALCLARRRSNLREMGLLLWGLGYNNAFAGHLEKAKEQLSEGVSVARSIGDSFCLVLSITQLSLALLGQGEDEAAEEGFRECIPRCRRLCQAFQYTLPELHLCYEGFAILAAETGDLRRAARLLGFAWAKGRPGPDEIKPDLHPPAVQQRYARMRQLLASAPKDYRQDWEWGRTLDPAQADRFALDGRAA